MRLLLAKMALLVAAVALAVALLEVALRLAGVSYPSFHTWDEHRGTALRPGARGWYREEGEAWVEINSDGLRDREHRREKPAGTLRIAVLGDSFAAALQVPVESTFWAVLERELATCPALSPAPVEVINFGVSGYGTAQELLTLRHHAWSYDPDLVILAFLTGNDVNNNSRALEGDPMRPYFLYQGGELVLDDSFRDLPAFRFRQSALGRFSYWFSDFSRVAQLVSRSLRNLRAGRLHAHQEERHAVLEVGEELGLESAIYSEPTDLDWQEAWRVTEGLLKLTHQEVQDGGAELLVVTLSNGIQVHPEAVVRERFAARLGVDDLFYPERRIEALGDREGIAVLTLAPAMKSFAQRHQVFLHGFGPDLGRGHWNPDGHRRAGVIIAEHLCRDPDSPLHRIVAASQTQEPATYPGS